MADFYIQNDDKEPLKLSTSGDEQLKIRSYSDEFLFVEAPENGAPHGEIPVRLEHVQLSTPIEGSGRLLPAEFKANAAVKVLKVEMVGLAENVKKVWRQFFENKLKSLKAKDIMSNVPLTCGTEEKCALVIEKINNARVGSIAVLNSAGYLEGIFTERDVLKNSLYDGFKENVVNDYMTKNPTCIDPEAPVEEVYLKFKGANFRHLPVAKDNVLLGMISIRDLLRYWTKLLEIQRDAISKKYEKAMSVIVHDLRSPIYAIRSINELVLDELEDPQSWKEQGFPEMVNDSCKSMIALIDELLDISELKSGEIRLKKEEVDIKELLEKSLGTFKPSADAKNIELESKLNEVSKVQMDKRKITQVIQNLVSNAIKYTNKDGRVTIHLFENAQKICFEVIDYGQGIPKNELKHIFEELTKISSTPTGDEPSTGLGLSITKKIVEAHGGTISATSEPHKETRFVVEFKKSAESDSHQVA